MRSEYAKPNTDSFVDFYFSHQGREYHVWRQPEYERMKLRGDAELSGRISMHDEADQKATILTYFYPEVMVEKMRSYRKKQ